MKIWIPNPILPEDAVDESTTPPKPLVCVVDGCERVPLSVGLCGLHYNRRLNQKRKKKAPRNKICIIEDCNKPSVGQGLCSKHYSRAYSGKNVMDSSYKRKEPELGKGRWRAKNNYISVKVPAGTPGSSKGDPAKNKDPRMLEHRWVMQRHLGRALLSTEQVHHKNGIRDDNRIENLELKSGAHGSGISVTDDVLHCLDRIERHAGLDLYERAVLAGIRDKTEKGLLGIVLPLYPPKRKR